MNDQRLERIQKLMTLSVAAKQYANAIADSIRAADARAALGTNTTRARMTTANARWMRCAEDRDEREALLIKAIEALDIGNGDHIEDPLGMVGGTCKDVLQVADVTAVRKYTSHGAPGPLWEFNESALREFARRLAGGWGE